MGPLFEALIADAIAVSIAVAIAASIAFLVTSDRRRAQLHGPTGIARVRE